jgi:lysophospholipase L1-like esterase
MKPILPMLAALLVLAGSASAQTVDSLAGKKTIFLGDSITQAGEYVTFTEYYLEKLYPRKNFDIYGLGLASETVSGLSEPGHAGGAFPRPDLSERLGRTLQKVKPDVVFACYGINDGIYLPLDEGRFAAFRTGISNLVSGCKAAGVADVFLITPPIYDFTAPAGAFNYDSVMTKYAAWEMTLKIPGVHVIDLHTAMRKARDARTDVLSPDHVHPGNEGHLLMARTLLGAIGVAVPVEAAATAEATPLYQLVKEHRRARSELWMNHIGYTREGRIAPQPLGKEAATVAKLQERINALRAGQ